VVVNVIRLLWVRYRYVQEGRACSWEPKISGAVGGVWKPLLSARAHARSDHQLLKRVADGGMTVDEVASAPAGESVVSLCVKEFTALCASLACGHICAW